MGVYCVTEEPELCTLHLRTLIKLHLKPSVSLDFLVTWANILLLLLAHLSWVVCKRNPDWNRNCCFLDPLPGTCFSHFFTYVTHIHSNWSRCRPHYLHQSFPDWCRCHFRVPSQYPESPGSQWSVITCFFL